MRIPAWRWLAAAGLALLLVQAVAWGRSALPGARLVGSRSHGIAIAGGLSFGQSLAPQGPDHRVSVVTAALGRAYVHGDVAQTLRAALAEEREASAARDLPAPRWQLGEAGWRTGGWFPPHLTHQDGLAIDLVVPAEAGVDRTARVLDALCRQAPKHGLVARAFFVPEADQGAIRGRMRTTCRRAMLDVVMPFDGQIHVTFTPKGRR